MRSSRFLLLLITVGSVACDGPVPATVHRVATQWRPDGAVRVQLQLRNAGSTAMHFAAIGSAPQIAIEKWAYGGWARQPEPDATVERSRLPAGETMRFTAELPATEPATRIGVAVTNDGNDVTRMIWSEPFGPVAQRLEGDSVPTPPPTPADEPLVPPDEPPVAADRPDLEPGSAVIDPPTEPHPPGESVAVEPTEPPLETAVLGEPPPARPDALRAFAQAQKALGKRKHKRAARLLGQCLRRDPQASECQRLLGDTFAAWRKPRKAIRAYQRYLERWPDLPNAEPTRRSLAEIERAQAAR